MLDNDAANRVARELESGEQLLWSGRPDPKQLSRRALPVLLFGIPFTAFAVFWMLGAAGITSLVSSGFRGVGAPGGLGLISLVFPLFGIPFVLVGLWMLTMPAREAARGARMLYAVTNRRALILEGGSETKVKSYTPRDMQNLERTERADGSGDLIFSRERRVGAKGRSYFEPIGFFGVPDVRTAEAILRQAMQSNTRGTH